MAAAPALVIDTATAACSVALIDGGTLVASRHEIVGRGHAEQLVPLIDTLLRDAGVARPSAVRVGCGPGSFTGVRVGLAAAIGLGIGWGVEVAGISSTALIAAALFDREPATDVCAVALAGGHGELFVERFARHPFASIAPLASLPPAVAAGAIPDAVVAGTGADTLVAARGHGRAVDLLPDAAEARLLPPDMLLPARPIYGRAPDAKAAA